MNRIAFAIALTLLLGETVLPDASLGAQEVDRESYLRQLPLSIPRLGPRSEATERFHLFGDPGASDYRDVAPVDGIDDRRHQVLEALAVRFAPYLVQNTSNFPTSFRHYIRNRDSFALTIDTWDVGSDEAHLLATGGVNLSALDGTACQAGNTEAAFERSPEPTSDSATEDCKLLELLNRFAPGTGEMTSVDLSRVRTMPSLFDVLFLNFPGDGARTWDQAYEDEYRLTPQAERASFPHSYVHPFVLEVEGGWELLLQYWFFYPTNDSGMDHEGDWEHVNVVVSPMSMVEGPLDEATLAGIIEERIPVDGTDDPLVIRRVDYYFHDLVMPLDFSTPNVYLPRDEWKAQADAIEQTRFREGEIWDQLRYMAWMDDAETIPNTHPFGHIGSDNKGLNQILEAPGGSNRDSHGTFPLPGRYNNVGPGGTTDQISGYVDSREFLRDLQAGRENRGPNFRRGSVLALDVPERLTMVPDWERILDLARSDARVRADWAWLLLPIHWGYPATVSPFSGVIEHYNTGNVAPVGPSFSTGWNRSGPTSSFKLYEPHTIAAVFPLQFQDNFRNELGFLNLTVPTFLNLPPFDFLSRIVAYPFRMALGRPDPVYYPREGVPFRFVGLSTGMSTQYFDNDFASLALNPLQLNQFVGSLRDHLINSGATADTELSQASDFNNAAVTTFVQVPFYIGGRFTSENTFRNSRHSFGLNAEFNNIGPYSYSAEINYWEYAGSIRYALSSRSLQPFVKAGYGWAWYRLENAQAVGKPFDPVNGEWIKPGILPNVLHYGLGVEYIPWKRSGEIFSGLDVAIRAELVRYSQKLGLNLDEVPLSELGQVYPNLGDVPRGERLGRWDLLLGFTLSF